MSGLRASGAGVPIIVISAKDTVADRVALLSLGADDYLVKPFDLGELVARVAAQLRGRGFSKAGERAAGLSAASGVTEPDADDTAVVTVGRWTLDSAARTFAVDGTPVALTNIEFNIVELLMHHPHQVFTKQQLYELCWHGEYLVDDNTVTAHISRIRAKLKPTGTDGYIATVWGLGVRLDVH